MTRRKVAALIGDAKRNGIDLIVTSTYRSFAEQDALYAIGRTKDVTKRKVTNAKGGESWHNTRRAADVAVVIGGKPVWDEMDAWPLIGQLGRNHGLEWGGDWPGFTDLPHFQWRYCEKHGKIHEKAVSFTESGACVA